MNWNTLTSRSLRFYRRSNLWVLLGTAMCTSIMVGALIVGDSVQSSLSSQVLERLGQAEYVLNTGDRFFRKTLADSLAKHLDTTVAPILRVSGIVISGGGEKRLNRVQVVGVDDRFYKIGNVPELTAQMATDEGLINHRLASRLNLSEGESFLLRVEKWSAMPKEAPLSSAEKSTTAALLTVKAIVEPGEFGNFDLENNQVTPYTVFLPIARLAGLLGVFDRANGLLVAENTENPLTSEKMQQNLKENWTLTDAGLSLKILGRDMKHPKAGHSAAGIENSTPVEKSASGERRLGIHSGTPSSTMAGPVKTTAGSFTAELTADRIFLESSVVDASKAFDSTAEPVLTYFVNEIRHQEKATPYSFVSAPGENVLPVTLQENDILVNKWLASDLDAKAGDEIELRYFVFDHNRKLTESSAVFRIRAVVPMRDRYADRDLMPDLPGLSGEAHCRDWEAGFPIDFDRIRPKDERYWSDNQGTPKAFIRLDTAQKLWQNRFGNATAIRFTTKNISHIEKGMLEQIDPGQLGFHFRNQRREGQTASAQSVDFGQLFLGLSFFVIAAALMLTGMLYTFNVEQREGETGLLLAIGFCTRQIRRMLLIEGALIVLLGGLLGIPGGIAFNQIILSALTTIWSGAVGQTSLSMEIRPLTALTGFLAGIVPAFLVIWLLLRKTLRKPVSDLQKNLITLRYLQRSRRWTVALVVVCLLVSGILIGVSLFQKSSENVGSYFAAGSLLLIGGLGLIDLLLRSLGLAVNSVRTHPILLGIRNLTRRPKRSLTLIGLLASSLFIVFTVGANRKQTESEGHRRASGTGGFALVGESVVPILYDLNTAEGLSEYGLEDLAGLGAQFVQFHVREGDDASCLNLNHVRNPQLLGVQPPELADRQAFTFSKLAEGVETKSPWKSLELDLGGDIVPGIADLTVITWGLGKSVGDTLTFLDERGRTFFIKLVGGLANSIFQGNIIISLENLIKRYPSVSGSHLLLVDAPSQNVNAVTEKMTWALQDQGLDLITTTEKLVAFNRVENTYLSIFLVLGGFGVLFGSFGIGIVVLRNMHERRRETALLRAVGFGRERIRSLVLIEHMIALGAGTMLGLIASLLATAPVLLKPGTDVPVVILCALFVSVLLNGTFWVFLTTAWGSRISILPNLRNE